MLRTLVGITAGCCVIVGCSATDSPVAPTQGPPIPALKLGDGAPPLALEPYAIDPSGEGLARATWKQYAGLPDLSGVPQHAISLSLADGARDGFEAGVVVTGVAGMPLPKEIGLDFKNGGACTAEGGLQLELTTDHDETITLDCATGTFAPSPVEGAKEWTRVAWSLEDLLASGTITRLKAFMKATKRPNLGILIGGFSGVDAQPGWPGLKVYVTDATGHRVIRLAGIDPSTGSVQGILSLGTSGSGTYQFSTPSDVYVDDAERIHVADSYNSRIVRFDDMRGAGWTSAYDSGCTSSQFYGCILRTVAGDGNGGLLSHIEGGSVYRTSMILPWRLTHLTQSTYEMGADLPWSLDAFADYRGRFYVTRKGNSVWRYDSDQATGSVRLALTPAPSRPGTRDLRSLFVDDAMRIYIADHCRITRFNDIGGAGKTAFPATTCFNADFAGPEGVGADDFGRIYFVTTFNGVSRVHRMDDMNGTGLVVLASFPNSRLVSIWVDDRTPHL